MSACRTILAKGLDVHIMVGSLINADFIGAQSMH